MITYVCIDYLACQSKQLSEMPVVYTGGSKHGDKRFNIILGIGILDLLMNLIYCRGFFKNIKICCHIKISSKNVGIL